MKLITRSNTKTLKGESAGWGSAILHLAPSDLSGHNVCPWASPGCIANCLNTAGRGAFRTTQAARIRKTKELFDIRPEFIDQLKKDIWSHIRWCERNKLKPCVRLNGTSDIPWEGVASKLFVEFPDVQFYDYTKGYMRMSHFLNGKFPNNYHLTFSRSEEAHNHAECELVLSNGGNVAMVFWNKPSEYMGYPVVDGDQHDLTFLHASPAILALSPKGEALHDETGFVVRA